MCGGCAVLDTLQMMAQRRHEKLNTKETKIEDQKAKIDARGTYSQTLMFPSFVDPALQFPDMLVGQSVKSALNLEVVYHGP